MVIKSTRDRPFWQTCIQSIKEVLTHCLNCLIFVTWNPIYFTHNTYHNWRSFHSFMYVKNQWICVWLSLHICLFCKCMGNIPLIICYCISSGQHIKQGTSFQDRVKARYCVQGPECQWMYKINKKNVKKKICVLNTKTTPQFSSPESKNYLMSMSKCFIWI